MGSTFDVRFQLLADTIPSGRNCKTAVGRKRKCRELMEFRRTAVQLYQYADTDADHRRADELLAEVDRRREELGRGGHFARQIEEDRAQRPVEEGLELLASLLRLAKRLPADHPYQDVVKTVMTNVRNILNSASGFEHDGGDHANNSQPSG